MDSKEYLNKRLIDQISWYSEKSSHNQKWYKTFQIIKIVLAVSIPVFSLVLEDETLLKIVVSTIGALIAILETVSRLNAYKDLWVKYRMTSESLKREKILFETEAPPYNVKNPFTILVIRSEKIMSSENQFWTDLQDENVSE